MRKLLLSLMLAMTLAIGSAATAVAAIPAGTYTDTVAGIETAVPTSPASTFAGYAFGQLPGFWTASVIHESLPTTPGGTGTINGGSLALYTRSGVVTGTFNTGSITLLGGTCTQTFRVQDTLTLANGTGTGTFDAYLTHYGYVDLSGHCNVFFATVHGGVTLILGRPWIKP